MLSPRPEDRILDLGGHDGSHLGSIIPFRENVTIADIATEPLERAKAAGFQTMLLDESGAIAAPDGAFDIVFCSSVIEHVTVPKSRLAEYRSTRAFEQAAFAHQLELASEIRRVGKRYFVQTPYRYSPVESHTWLPGVVVLLPRRILMSLIRRLNRFWPKTTEPDWNLLTVRDMRRLFPDAQIVKERTFGLTKSLMAIKA